MPAIGQVAKQTGLKVTTIRFYETEGLLAAPKRAANGRRVYSDAEEGADAPIEVEGA